MAPEQHQNQTAEGAQGAGGPSFDQRPTAAPAAELRCHLGCHLAGAVGIAGSAPASPAPFRSGRNAGAFQGALESGSLDTRMYAVSPGSKSGGSPWYENQTRSVADPLRYSASFQQIFADRIAGGPSWAPVHLTATPCQPFGRCHLGSVSRWQAVPAGSPLLPRTSQPSTRSQRQKETGR